MYRRIIQFYEVGGGGGSSDEREREREVRMRALNAIDRNCWVKGLRLH